MAYSGYNRFVGSSGGGDELNNAIPPPIVPGGYNPRFHFAAAQDAGFDTGTADTNPRTIYVGNLDQSVTEDFLTTLFSQIGTVTKCKIIFDGINDSYAFVEFGDHNTASQALTAMNKRVLMNKTVWTDSLE